MAGPFELVEAPAESSPSTAPVCVSIGSLEAARPDDGTELLKTRYLCRGGGMLLVGPTGVGKSTFAMQAALCWAIGRPFFGIEPAKPLVPTACVQKRARGDRGSKIRGGVLRGGYRTAARGTQARPSVD